MTSASRRSAHAGPTAAQISGSASNACKTAAQNGAKTLRLPINPLVRPRSRPDRPLSYLNIIRRPSRPAGSSASGLSGGPGAVLITAQCRGEVRNKVVGVLDADREADQRIA